MCQENFDHGEFKVPNWMWSRVQNPEYTGHQFRFELDTDSGTDWTVILILSGQ